SGDGTGVRNDQAGSGEAARRETSLRYRRWGPIAGMGGETDDANLAWLSHNEYVVRASSHRKYGTGFLDAINEGTFPGFADGGSFSIHTGQLDYRPMIDGIESWIDQQIGTWAAMLGNQMSATVPAYDAIGG